MESGSIDAVVTDPPYAEINRQYGRLSECEWHSLMNAVIPEVRRVLKPSGSAVFILQPNSSKAGKMRLWLWEFMVRWGREWNLIQDAYWWNWCALPKGGCTTQGLLRGSVKPCVWLGNPDCYRNQEAVLWLESDYNKARRVSAKCFRVVTGASGSSCKEDTARGAAKRRGGTTPFNLIPCSTTYRGIKESSIHGARTPYPLAEWWIKYLCPAGGIVLDPFMGVGTIGEAAENLGRNYIGIEQKQQYYDVAKKILEGGDIVEQSSS
jgi:site-specific DNA-methyltransferase (cytosine-N4-specific)